MRRKAAILICSLMLGLGLTGSLVISEKQEPVQTVAWWSVMYEMPNPERLPVQVHFRWLKGLE
ncbi:MAG: hypothetical protein KH452_03860 [Clostridiales bacterium]|nr:hypothetical protein [Clostridiales bacterium]